MVWPIMRRELTPYAMSIVGGRWQSSQRTVVASGAFSFPTFRAEKLLRCLGYFHQLKRLLLDGFHSRSDRILLSPCVMVRAVTALEWRSSPVEFKALRLVSVTLPLIPRRPG